MLSIFTRFLFHVDINDLLLKERFDVLKTSDVTVDFVDNLPGNNPCVVISSFNQAISPILKRIKNLTRISLIGKSKIFKLKSTSEKNHYLLVFKEVTSLIFSYGKILF